jgi:hypothetical protein
VPESIAPHPASDHERNRVANCVQGSSVFAPALFVSAFAFALAALPVVGIESVLGRS